MGSGAQRELVHDRFLLLADCQPTDPDGLKVAEEDDVNCKGVWLSVDCAQASAVPILYMHVRIVQSGAGKSDLQDERTNRSGPDTPREWPKSSTQNSPVYAAPGAMSWAQEASHRTRSGIMNERIQQ